MEEKMWMTDWQRVLRFLSLVIVVGCVAMASSRCLGSEFRRPVSSASISCTFNTTQCAAPGKYHTGIDYGTGSGLTIYAVNCGTVALVQRNGQNDHGMGNCLVIRHRLSNGSTVYSLYAHLASIASGLSVGSTVSKSQVIAQMGGSGYGNANY